MAQQTAINKMKRHPTTIRSVEFFFSFILEMKREEQDERERREGEGESCFRILFLPQRGVFFL